MIALPDRAERMRLLELIDRCQRIAAECAHTQTAQQLLALAAQHILSSSNKPIAGRTQP